MPTFQPSHVIDRRGQNNNVNISGAILNPLAQGLGEGLTMLGKEAFDLYSPAERYQQTLIAANERALDEKIGSSWDEQMADPNFASRVESDPDFKYRWGLAKYGNEDKARAFVDTHVDPMLSGELRKVGEALKAGSATDPVPNLAGGATVGTNPNAGGYTPPSAPAQAGPAEVPVAEGLQVQQDTKQQIQQGHQSSVQSAPSSQAVPEVPGVAPVAPPSPQGVPETKPEAGLVQPQPLDTARFQDQVKAYMIRQQGRLGLYRQAVNAAATGKMDAEQASLGAALSGVHQAELTTMMETVAPSLGIPLRDNDGKPIQGGALLDGMAHTFISTNPEGFKKLPAQQQSEMLQASDRYQSLLRNMDAAKATKFQTEMVDKFSKSKLASPEAFLTYANAEATRQQNIIEHRDGMKLKERAMDLEETKLASYLETQAIANEGQRIQLAITRKYAGPQAELQMQKARVELDGDLKKLTLLTSREERDNLTSLLSAINSKAEADAKRGVVWYNDNQRKQTGYLKGLAAVNEQMNNLQTKNGPLLNVSYDRMTKLRAQMKDDSKIDAWISTQPPEFQKAYRGASPSEKFDQYYRAQDPQYAAVAGQMDDLRRQRDNLDALFTKSVSAEAPNMGSDALAASLQGYTQGLVDKQLAPLMKAEMKGLYKDAPPEAWTQVLQENPTSVNILLGKTLSRQPDDKGWNNSNQPGIFNESKGLLIFAQGSLAAGKQFDAQSFSNVNVGGKKLKDVIGPGRIGNYYNSYVQLLGELK